MTRFLARRPLGWLLLGLFSALYSCRAAIGGLIALEHGDCVIVFWRTVELVFFSVFAVASIRRTRVPPDADAS